MGDHLGENELEGNAISSWILCPERYVDFGLRAKGWTHLVELIAQVNGVDIV